jgi:Flp pilus assembly protein TadG
MFGSRPWEPDGPGTAREASEGSFRDLTQIWKCDTSHSHFRDFPVQHRRPRADHTGGGKTRRSRAGERGRGVVSAFALRDRALRDQRRARGESGASMVELAIILPIFLLLVFGVIQFGITYNNAITVRQGTREAARQGAVGNFGSTGSCSLHLTDTPSADVQKLMCLAKQQVGLSYSNTRVKILSGSADFSSAGSFQKGEALIVCVQYPVDAMAKFVSPVLGGAVLKSKTSMRIEASYTNTESGGQETALSGSSWSWCTVSGAAP